MERKKTAADPREREFPLHSHRRKKAEAPLFISMREKKESRLTSKREILRKRENTPA